MSSDHSSDNIQSNTQPSTNSIQTSRKDKSSMFSLLFIAFMVLVGGGILVTRFSNSQGSETQPSLSANVSGKTPVKNAVTFSTATPEPVIKVYVTGEIKNPGIYTMQKDDRIVDALDAAGGVTDSADITQLDLAQRVRDEMRINIPKSISSTPGISNGTPASSIISNKSNPTDVSNSSSSTNVASPNNNGVATHASTVSSSKIGPDSGVKINVNTADTNELERLPGVGATLAQRLIDYRTKHGPFTNLDDLHHIQGFTKTVVDKLKDLVSF